MTAPVGAATVLLRHDLPDGTRHVDWMLDSCPTDRPATADERRLVTFRLTGRIDELEAGMSTVGERIADHRRAYLDYEGAVSGDRGRVTRLMRGGVEAFDAAEDGSFTVRIRWEAGGRSVIQRLRLEAVNTAASPAGWVVHCVSRQFSAQ